MTNGGARDTDELIKQRTPVYSRYISRTIRPGRVELDAVQVPVNVGGALVNPGDVVVADGDGVVVVPAGARRGGRRAGMAARRQRQGRSSGAVPQGGVARGLDRHRPGALSTVGTETGMAPGGRAGTTTSPGTGTAGHRVAGTDLEFGRGRLRGHDVRRAVDEAEAARMVHTLP